MQIPRFAIGEVHVMYVVSVGGKVARVGTNNPRAFPFAALLRYVCNAALPRKGESREKTARAVSFR